MYSRPARRNDKRTSKAGAEKLCPERDAAYDDAYAALGEAVQGAALRGIIVLYVRWYRRHKLSYCDRVEMMAEHGLALSHTTILRWGQRFV